MHDGFTIILTPVPTLINNKESQKSLRHFRF